MIILDQNVFVSGGETENSKSRKVDPTIVVCRFFSFACTVTWAFSLLGVDWGCLQYRVLKLLRKDKNVV